MRILVACEFSGIVREAFTKRGHEVWSCDLIPTELPGQHLMLDALTLAYSGSWDLLIAHPPCTYLSNAGNPWIHQPGRLEKRELALEFFLSLYQAPIPRVCVENPAGYPNRVFRKPDQVIHPYHFGTPVQKKTCLWIRGLPLLVHPEVPKPEPFYYDPKNGRRRDFVDVQGGRDKAKKRSRTFPCIAEAMATQWGSLAIMAYD